jgi:hypothetical protein
VVPVELHYKEDWVEVLGAPEVLEELEAMGLMEMLSITQEIQEILGFLDLEPELEIQETQEIREI